MNLARNGRSSKSYIDEGHWRAAVGAGRRRRADPVRPQRPAGQGARAGDRSGDDVPREPRALHRRGPRGGRAAGHRHVADAPELRRPAGGSPPTSSPTPTRRKRWPRRRRRPLVDLHAREHRAARPARPVRRRDVRRPQGGRHARSDAPVEGGQRRRSGPSSPTSCARPCRRSRSSCTPAAPATARSEPGRSPWTRPVPGAAGRVVRLGGGRPHRRTSCGSTSATTGGWPKNIDMARALDRGRAAARSRRRRPRRTPRSTTARRRRRCGSSRACTRRPRADGSARGVLDGHRLPARGAVPRTAAGRSSSRCATDYSRHITFNDDAMVNVLEVLRDVAAGGAAVRLRRRRARGARAEAVDARASTLILAAQVRVQAAR